MQSWFPFKEIYFSLNGVSWYLSVCTLLYFSFPLIINYIKKKKIRSSIALVVLVYICQILLAFVFSKVTFPFDFFGINDTFLDWSTYLFPIYRLGDFFIGCVLGYCYLFFNKDTTKYNWNAVEFLSVIFVMVSLFFSKFEHLNSVTNVIMKTSIWYLPSSALLIFTFAINKGFISRFLTNRFTVYIGNISSYTFLIHQLTLKILHMIFKIFNLSLNVYVDALIALVVVLVLSELYRILDKCLKIIIKR